MSLTEEQQQQVEQQNAIEGNRASLQASAEAKRIKAEAVKTAKEILMENRRTTAAADVMDITAEEIMALATKLSDHINA
jgi:regulator of protease activity HflC (stomatin/prohibitin superfamily)|tara:strand:- start:1968 stop:2204 length:237 start_codon:yes stop_codon:yes gene_type:complete